MKPIYKYILIVLGFISLFFGIIGIFLPLLPTTPFIMLSAICFAHSSPKLYEKMINTKYIGKVIEDYRDGKGMRKSAVTISISFLWIALLLSYFLSLKILWVKYLLLTVGVGVTIHILQLRKKHHS
ncbi:MAG: hypothetical protein A2X64_00260 [Ignavibacteria bacterium GWF2_33_9]|nr:MAG: hypothetical protein A2X64_00260 [Ignavibacteria bacterium GWF2_33_9]